MNHFRSDLERLQEEPTDKPTEEKPKKRAGRVVDAAGTSAAATREIGKSEQRGMRADEKLVQVNAFVRRELKASLFFYLKQENRTLSELIKTMLEEYVEERGGVIQPPKPKPKKR
jgi:hypothetical protein